jgi:hypothetical protein
MTIEFLSFLVGSVLVGVAVIGGGFEIKELKMPRVGVAVRLISLAVGGGFIMLALAIFAWRQYPQLASAGTEAPVGNALVEPKPSDLAGSAPTDVGVQPSADPASIVSESLAPPDEFGGFEGTSVLTWSMEEIPYTAVLTVNGQRGIATVSWTDANGQQSVDEELQLEQDGQGIRYVGSNPRYSGTSTPYPEYRPDTFTIVRISAEEWTYAQACDAASCSPVQMQPAG